MKIYKYELKLDLSTFQARLKQKTCITFHSEVPVDYPQLRLRIYLTGF